MAAAPATRQGASGSSSTAKPGPSVASSNSTPPGSRKYTDLNQKRSITGVGRRPAPSTCVRTASCCGVVGDAPRQVMDAADAPRAAARLGRHFPDVDILAGAASAHGEAVPVALGADVAEAEDVGQERRREREAVLPQPRALEAAHLALDGDRAVVPRRERPRQRVGRFDQRDAQAVRVDQRQRAAPEAELDRILPDAVARQPLTPELEAARRHRQRHLDAQAVAHRAAAPCATTERTSGRCRDGLRHRRRTGDRCPGRPG